jgi:hypothetical protein
MSEHLPEPRPVAVCAICGEPATKAAEVLINALRIFHIACAKAKSAAV